MFKEKIAQKTISVLLSALMVITMVPVLAFTSFAQGETAAVSTTGEWEHEKSTDYTDGRGSNYVSMWFKGLDFQFVQTKDDEQFVFTSEFWAVKNDGVNTASINSVTYSGSILPSSTSTWSKLTSQSVSSAPTNVTLPGSLGSGYTSQMSSNLIKWSNSTTFKANGAANYNLVATVSYTAGSTGYTTSTYTTSGEPINITVNVCDKREIISAVEKAQNALLNDTTLDETQRSNLTSLLETVTANDIASASVYTEQSVIDEITKNILSNINADYTAYLSAAATADYIMNSPKYSDEEKQTISVLLADRENVLSKPLGEQSYVDNATSELLKAIDALTRDNLGAPNQGNSQTTSAEGQFVFQPKDGVSSYQETDRVYITLNHTKVYLDKSEDLSVTGLTWTYNCGFGAKQYVSAPLSTNCLGASAKNGVGNVAQTANYDTYFSNYSQGTYANNAACDLVNTTSNTAGAQTATVSLDGSPLAVTGDDGAKVYLGYYWKHMYDGGFMGIGNYSRYSYDSYELYNTPETPFFTVVVYDKSELKTVIDEAGDVLRKTADNYDEYVALIDRATEIYNTREVTQSQIDEVIAQLENFKFSYTVDIPANNSEVGYVETSVVSGEKTGENAYTENSVVALTPVVTNPDYIFTGWSDGSTENPREITVGVDSTDFTADFKFVPADYSEVTKLLQTIDNLDKSLFTADSLAQLNSVVTSIDTTLGISSQATVDSYASALENALNSLENKPCDYTALDKAISDATLSNDNGKYTDSAYKTYLDALEAANNVDKGLTLDADGVNQNTIDTAAQNLANAITALKDPSNINYSVTVKDENGETVAEIFIDKTTETTFGEIKDKLTEPATDETHTFVGWEDENGNIITDDTVITGDMTISPAIELTKITPNSNGNTIFVDRDTTTEYTYMVGLNASANTVAQLKTDLENDDIQIIITRNDVVLDGNDLVGTGCVIKCVSTKNPEIVYEVATVILYGDVNGDGLIDSTDQSLLRAKAFHADNSVIKDGSVFYIAADMDGDTALDAFDFFIQEKQVSGRTIFDQTLTLYK